MSPIGQNIVIPKKIILVKKRPNRNWQSCVQHYSLYCQPKPEINNRHQQYRHDRIIQKAYSKNDYDKDKGGSHDMIHSVIP